MYIYIYICIYINLSTYMYSTEVGFRLVPTGFGSSGWLDLGF